MLYEIHRQTRRQEKKREAESGKPIRHSYHRLTCIVSTSKLGRSRKEVFLDLLGLRLRFGPAASGIPFLDFTRKEVFQPHLPVRLPCYDLAPITGFALGRPSRLRTSGAPGFHGLTGGVYKARERIHRAMADARLLANPASRSRVADSDPN